MAGGWDRYLRLIEPGARWQWVAVVIFAVLVSGVEAVGAVLVYVLVGLATDPAGGADLPLLGDLRPWLPDMPADRQVAVTAVGVAAFFLVRAVLVLAQRYHQERVAQQTAVDLSAGLLGRYLRLPYAFHLRRNSSELIRNIHDSVGEILGSILAPSVKVLSDGLMIVAVLTVLVVTAPLATLLVAGVLVPLVAVVLRVVQPRLERLGAISQDEAARSYQALQQGLHGYRDIAVLGRQDFFLETFRRSRMAIAETRYKRAALSQLPRVSIEAVVIACIALFISVSALGGQAGESLAVLGLFGYAALRIMPALNKVISAAGSVRFGRAALDDVKADLALPVPRQRPGGDERLPFREALRLEEVTFRYEGASAPTLQAIDLTVTPGESIGIVGATGSGKSTLVDLIAGLSTPTRGRITVDGVELRGREEAWQRNIGMVSQHIFLLDDTLRGNIALGVPEEEVDEDRVAEAVRIAQLDELVDALPAGLGTTVGERGIRLSGGQRQRVAIARALYHGPTVLLFDEGTSALDNLTEARIVEALDHLRGERTIVTVAHRLSTVQGHNRIVFLRSGRVEDIGTFPELLARSPAFRQLARWAETPAT